MVDPMTYDAARVQQLLTDASAWKLAAMLFACPQDDWKSQVMALAREVADARLQQAAREMIETASEGLYHSTFGPGGPAAAREISHREYVTPGAALAEINVSYEVFAFRPVTDEPPDHVAVEADFMAYLRVKEAYAVTRDAELQASIAAEAAARFAENHVAFIAEPLHTSLTQSGVEYLRLVSQWLLDRVGPAPRLGPFPDAALPILREDNFDCCESAEGDTHDVTHAAGPRSV